MWEKISRKRYKRNLRKKLKCRRKKMWEKISNKRYERNIRKKPKHKRKIRRSRRILKTNITIQAPINIDLYKDYSDTIKKFGHKKYEKNNKRLCIKIDFCNTDTITLSGAIYLHGFFQYLAHHNIDYKFKRPREDIQSVITPLKNTNENEVHKVKNWFLIITSETINAEKIGKITNAVCKNSDTRAIVYDSIFETLQNSLVHPYTKDAEFKKSYSLVGIVKDTLIICTYDHGMGFKQSYLNNPNVSKTYKKSLREDTFVRIKDESKLIKEIIQQKKGSGTRKEYRGQGLPSILQGIKRLSKKNTLFIYSRKGCYMHSKNNRREVEHNREELDGTLVHIEIALPVKENAT